MGPEEHGELSRPRRRLPAVALLAGLAGACGSSPPPVRIVPEDALRAPARKSSAPVLRIGLTANANGGFDPALAATGPTLGDLVTQLDIDGALGPEGLWLDNGDLWTHAPVVRVEGADALLTSLDRAGLDAINLGHHDYEVGPDALTTWSRRVGFRFLAANVTTSAGATPPFAARGPDPSSRRAGRVGLVAHPGGVRTCVIGLAHVDTPRRVRAATVEGLRFTGYVEALEPALQRAWTDGCQLTVALVHDEPSVVAALVGALPPDLPLDLAVAADESSFRVRRVGSTVVVHPGAYAREVALVEVRPGGREAAWRIDVARRPVEARVASAHAREALRPWWAAVDRARRVLDREIGLLPRLLTPGTFGQSDLGHFVCDAWLEAFDDADVAVLNHGALRAALPEGVVTEGDLRSALPFDDRLARVDLTAAELSGLLETGAPVVGGMTWSYRTGPSDGARAERQVMTVLGPRGRALAPQSRLRLVTVDFVSAGGDGFALPDEARRHRTSVDWRDPVRARLGRTATTTPLPSASRRARRLRSPPSTRPGGSSGQFNLR